MPAGEIGVMVITVAVVVVTHNLAVGVVVGSPAALVASSVAALDAVEAECAARGKSVRIVGLNQPSARMRGALSGEPTGGH
ncbi:hypothetical protein [Nonomuraea bangladeshensis]|uniref:hypothetical protein n=1 Tax=Nonomuraea bangladeshensis TaxID=404385 RepID=UPI0031D01AE1